ncbi:MAG TPA: hypothetical protein VI248_20390 [Kineosporiaceae bacterium]
MQLVASSFVENNSRSAQSMLRAFGAAGTQAVLTPGVCCCCCGAVVPVQA